MASKQNNEPFGDHLLTCSICYEHFKKPKVLPCLHSFCTNCVTRHHEIYRLCNGGKLSCPTCRAIIPIPGNGIPGFMNDGVVTRVKRILKALPAIDFINSTDTTPLLQDERDVMMAVASPFDFDDEDEDLSDDETPSRRREYAKPDTKPAEGTPLVGDDAQGAVALPKEMIKDSPDPPIVVKKRAALRKEQQKIQGVIAHMRNKMLELYHIENYVRSKVEQDQDRQLSEMQHPNKKQSKKIKFKIDEKQGQMLAVLCKEQDQLYRKIVDSKSIHDVMDEVLETASSPQMMEMYNFLMEQVDKIKDLIETERPKAKTDRLQGLAVPHDLIKIVRIEIESYRSLSLDGLKPSSRDPRKIGIKLLFKLSGLGEGPGKFDFPTHATFMPNGDLLVADKNNHRLQVFGTDGRFKKELYAGTIKPRRARVNPIDGCMYVCDEDSESVKIYNTNGELSDRVGDHYFRCAAGMDFDSNGNLVMVDPEKMSISIFDQKTHKMITGFLFRYMIDRKMPHPYYVCVNEDDQCIVSDSRNNRVKIFSPTGRLQLKIDKLNCPRGVTLDPYGNILIAEGDGHCVSMYNPYGKFLQYLIGRGELGLCYPLSLDMDNQGRLAVTQCGYTSPHEVMVYQMG